MAKNCCVCRDTKESSENRLFRCGGQGCGITVHQACYGIVTIPSGLWFCRKCESQERAARVKCELCPRKDGALKRTDSGTWAHVVCALYIPEVTFGNLRTMEPIITSKLPKERFAKVCYICEGLGQENQASTGACMSCHRSNCRQSFHVTCAQKEHLLVEEQDTRDSRNIIYCGYCSSHYKKMMKQKLRKQLNQNNAIHGRSGSGYMGVASGSMTAITSGVVSVGGSVGVVGNAHTSGSSSGSITNRMDTMETNIGGVASTVGVVSNAHSQGMIDNTVPMPGSSNMYTSHGVGGAYNHRNKVKIESDRAIVKRSSTEAGLPPSVKRKYRRRKLSSSNESTSSEAHSLASETASHLLHPSSPRAGSAHSPGVYHVDRRTEDEDTATASESQTGKMDCGNLELLASVTQRVDKVDRLTNEPSSSPSPCVTASNEPLFKRRGSSAHPVPPPVDSKEGIKRNVGVARKGVVGGGKKRKSSNAIVTNNQQSTSTVSSQLSPPTSLQELLERQWEQTAQFILDQAGKQNNAGVMLAHLHELQSENRSMQSRIMELASQREFFIATNSRLRQTLTGIPITKAINGIQTIPPTTSTPITNHAHHQFHRPMESNMFPARPPGNHRITETHTDTPTLINNPSSAGLDIETYSFPFSNNNSIEDKEDVTEYRHAHKSNHTHSSSASNSSIQSPSSSYLHTSETTPTAMHEVTHVTNSVQGPITAFTGFPDGHAPYSPHGPAPYSSHGHTPYSSHHYSHRHST